MIRNMVIWILVLMFFIFACGCDSYDSNERRRNIAEKIANGCSKTLMYVYHKNGWCIAACTDGLYPDQWYAMVVPCEAVERKIEK